MFLVGFRLYPFKFAQVFPNYGKNKSSILETFAEQVELKTNVKRIFIWSMSVFHVWHTDSLYKGQTAGFPDMD